MASSPNLSRRAVLERAQQLTLVAPFLSVVGCDLFPADGAWWTLFGTTMGTQYRVKVTSDGLELERHALERDIEQILETVNDQMSTYRATSELSRFNTAASTNWVSVSPDTACVVGEALRVSHLSAGAFDVTIGPLVDLWGFGPETPALRPPSVERIRAQLGKIGHGKLDARNARTAIRKAGPDLQVDLSGIAKGFAVDRLADYLEQSGADHYFVEIGGEMRVRGSSPNAGAWRIGVEKPVTGRRAIQRVLHLNDAAIATSGDYRIFFEDGGARYAHIIDPRTGLPVTHDLASVTVISPTTMTADAWSTALMVLGPDDGFRLAERLALTALFIVKTDRGLQETYTTPFGQKLVG